MLKFALVAIPWILPDAYILHRGAQQQLQGPSGKCRGPGFWRGCQFVDCAVGRPCWRFPGAPAVHVDTLVSKAEAFLVESAAESPGAELPGIASVIQKPCAKFDQQHPGFQPWLAAKQCGGLSVQQQLAATLSSLEAAGRSCVLATGSAG